MGEGRAPRQRCTQPEDGIPPARDRINGLGGLYDEATGILVGSVTKSEKRMRVWSRSLAG